MMNWQSYCNICTEKCIANPYENEAHFNRAYGISDYKEPLVITPKNQKRPMKPTFDNSEKMIKPKKEPKPKKPKAEKQPRKKMTDEERRVRCNAMKRERDEKRRREAGIKPKKALTDEERKAYKREYMKKWRALHPKASYEATMKWRRENPELNKQRRREEARRRRERLKNGA